MKITAENDRLLLRTDIETCEECVGAVKVIASTEKPEVVKRILDHRQNGSELPQSASHPVLAPPLHPKLDRPWLLAQPQGSDTE